MNTLRKSLLLLVCLRLFLPGETVMELFKLPSLVAHYLHHVHADGHNHIFGFLMEHYGTHQHHEQDAAEHRSHHQLPFSSHHSTGLKEPVQPFVTSVDLKYALVRITELPKNPLVCSDEQWHSQFSPSIWQPPKIG